MEKQFCLSVFIVCLLTLSSCGVKQLRYFNDLPDTTRLELPSMKQIERTVQDGDRLLITIGAQDPEAAALFNNYGGVSSSGSSVGGGSVSQSEIVGYLVGADGSIELPYIGKVQVSTLTAEEVKKKLTASLLPFLKEPFVIVKFYEIKFTVLGEVRSPGTYRIPLQRTTFLDALGAAGDLPITAKRNDIQVYRDYDGKRTIFTVDLRKKDVLYNPELFQIRHNDVIYVQPRDSRRFNEETRFYVSFLSLAVGLIAIFTKF